MPEFGSVKPDAPRSNCFTPIFASSGVSDASVGLIGPAVPSNFAVPPPGRFAVRVNGNCEVNEKFLTSMFTLSYTRGFTDEFCWLTVKRPSLTFSLATDKLGFDVSLDFAGSGEAGFEDEFPPRLEKFHFPEAA